MKIKAHLRKTNPDTPQTSNDPEYGANAHPRLWWKRINQNEMTTFSLNNYKKYTNKPRRGRPSEVQDSQARTSPASQSAVDPHQQRSLGRAGISPECNPTHSFLHWEQGTAETVARAPSLLTDSGECGRTQVHPPCRDSNAADHTRVLGSSFLDRGFTGKHCAKEGFAMT